MCRPPSLRSASSPFNCRSRRGRCWPLTVKPIPMPQQLKKKLGRTDLAMGYTWFDPREEGDEGVTSSCGLRLAQVMKADPTALVSLVRLSIRDIGAAIDLRALLVAFLASPAPPSHALPAGYLCRPVDEQREGQDSALTPGRARRAGRRPARYGRHDRPRLDKARTNDGRPRRRTQLARCVWQGDGRRAHRGRAEGKACVPRSQAAATRPVRS